MSLRFCWYWHPESINTTLPAFYNRLPLLLERNHFKQEFIDHKMPLVQEGYVVSKTNSRSMLGRINSISYNIEATCRTLPSHNSLILLNNTISLIKLHLHSPL